MPEPRTIFQGVYKLPPGHTLIASGAASAMPQPEQYWDVPFTLRNRQRPSRTPRHELIERLREAVQAAHDGRRAAGRVPVRRRRLERGRGDDGAA